MPTPQFITDNSTKKLAVVLPIKDYNKLIEELEEMDDIKEFDKAKTEDDGTCISIDEYVKNRNSKNV